MEDEKGLSDFLRGTSGVIKHALSRIPGVGEIINGYDAYKRSIFERNAKNAINYLEKTVADPESLFSDEWLKSEKGQQFFRKVFDSAVDAQLEDKQQLFLNALINGIENKSISYFEKLKFVDILRHLSLASIMVLAEMHKMFKDRVKGPGRSASPTDSIPEVNPVKVAETLSSQYEPFLVISAIYEMESQGLFSTIAEWQKQDDGSSRPGIGFSTALAYTDFTYKFVEFITAKEQKELDK